MRGWRWFGAALVAAGAGGCGGQSDDSSPTGCVPTRREACSCGDATGTRVCLADRTFSRCSCESIGGAGEGGRGGAGPGGAGSGGTSSGGASSGGTSSGGASSGGTSSGGAGSGGGGATGGSGGVSTEGALSAGPAVLIDAFPATSGVVVVLADALVLVDRDGGELRRIAWPREITAAAFDGALLVVADRAVMTSFDVDLNVVGSGNLTESCAAGVLVSGERFVCGPDSDIFYTYSARAGTLLASSQPQTYGGLQMRRVPGMDRFVTVTTNLSPSDFHLYTIAEDGAAVYLNDSPYHGDVRASAVYAFDGAPPAHLINDEGLLLAFSDETCVAGVFPSGCFLKDGVVGTLLGSERYIGMDNDAAGLLYALVAPGTTSILEERCAAGCRVQTIDVATRTVLSETTAVLSLGAVIAARHDATANALLVGYRVGTEFQSPNDPYPGHQVRLLPYSR